MITTYYFVEPLDVLMIRGNKSFGGAGQHGEAVMPPWPSLFAGAFRSALLGGDADMLSKFVSIGTDKNLAEEDRHAHMRDALGEALFATLGTPAEPGDFHITWVSLASTKGGVQPVLPLPADLAAFSDTNVPPLVALQPAQRPAGSTASAELPLTAILRVGKQVKPESGRWLHGSEFTTHLTGSLPNATLHTSALFKRETRLGISLNTESRTTETGALYTTEAISFCDGTGFLVGITGDHGLLPQEGLLRLGGDGKGASFRRVEDFNAPTKPSIQAGDCFRLILTTPGIFTSGWLPERVDKQADGSYRLEGVGFSARLVCAAVNRHDVISGWDLANWQPKTAQRTVPAGSVYWFDDLQGDPGKLAEWVARGLWSENVDSQRRAEGFNRALLAAWPNN
jgi:CRISPR-associated protein Cmr3